MRSRERLGRKWLAHLIYQVAWLAYKLGDFVHWACCHVHIRLVCLSYRINPTGDSVDSAVYAARVLSRRARHDLKDSCRPRKTAGQ